ncbi:hemagglutinin/amebocyte aggregation factor-like [Stylophora pistillata]|uniref:hemagglutinin/amebocyte aggregation factor-like n=1 Tax=Stylophora pistillata TaxID=50429 RepID=UPI000C0553D7|nr:hemagglutinin/amebocyte aggregation factor-like [Stylophora pistillata]
MANKRLVKLLLLMMLFELLIFPADVASWWRRRRRRRRPVCSSHRPTGVRWVNKWQRNFKFECNQNGRSVKLWKSIHRNCKEDRIHSFKCKVGPDPRHRSSDCAWEHFANSYDRPVVFKCPHNGFITGIRSEYSAHNKDRRFRFRCCHTDRLQAKQMQDNSTAKQLGPGTKVTKFRATITWWEPSVIMIIII